MEYKDLLNLIAIIIIPIVAVLIGQWLHIRSEKRKDKMQVFKILMMSRNGWTIESVQALNILDVVFVEDKEVRSAWKNLYDKYCVENPDSTHIEKIRQAQYKLLEAIAISLGYKDKITWETIQNPYIPNGMIEAQQQQREFQNGQLAWAKVAGVFSEQFTNQNVSTNDERDEGQK